MVDLRRVVGTLRVVRQVDPLPRERRTDRLQGLEVRRERWTHLHGAPQRLPVPCVVEGHRLTQLDGPHGALRPRTVPQHPLPVPDVDG